MTAIGFRGVIHPTLRGTKASQYQSPQKGNLLPEVGVQLYPLFKVLLVTGDGTPTISMNVSTLSTVVPLRDWIAKQPGKSSPLNERRSMGPHLPCIGRTTAAANIDVKRIFVEGDYSGHYSHHPYGSSHSIVSLSSQGNGSEEM